MRRARGGALLLSAVLALSVSAAPSAADCVIPGVGKTEKFSDSKIDTAVYSKVIAEGFDGRYVGYAVLLHDPTGRRLFFRRSGYAVTPCGQKPIPFTLDTKAAWGSVSKIITTAAVLRAAEQRDKDRGKAETLDTEFRWFLPGRWRGDMHVSLTGVTVADLLRHKAGFRHSGGGEHIRSRLSKGVETKKGVCRRQYSNASMGMFHYALMAMTSTGGNTMLRLEKQREAWSDAKYDEAMALSTGNGYYLYTRTQVLNPLNIDARCNMKDFVKTGNYSLVYAKPNSRLGKHHGVFVEDVTTHCASGGWIMSIKEMMRFLHALKHTDKIMGRNYYRLMEADTKNDNQLGWWTHPIAPGSFRHNGARIEPDGRKTIAEVVVYPNGYLAAFVANSPKPKNGRVLGVLVDAFNKSLK